MTEQHLFQGQTQKQTQIMSAQQRQALEILEMPALDLENRIREELAVNPVLERKDSGFTDNVPDTADHSEKTDENRDDFREGLEKMLESGDDSDWVSENKSDDGREWTPEDDDRSRNKEAEERRDYFFDSLTKEETLQDHLMEQLDTAEVTKPVFDAAEAVIGNLDKDGFFQEPLSEIVKEVHCSEEDAQQALELIQSFHPSGIGAAGWKESLQLQAKQKYGNCPQLIKLVEHYLEDIANNKLPQIAKKMEISMEKLQELLDKLHELNPRPASGFSTDTIIYTIPEVIVKRGDDGELHVMSNKEYEPQLSLSKTYTEMLDDRNLPKETKEYLQEKVQSGKNLISNLERRTTTILKVAETILVLQYDYFEEGPKALRPMTMQNIAERLGLDETTISRAVKDKYMKTPSGIVRIRDLFTGGFSSGEGETVSREGIKDLIRNAIEHENRKSPLSDAALADLLKSKGFEVARRTVLKYREELGYPSSTGRKEYS